PAKMDPTILSTLFEQSMIPVIAPLGAGQAGETFNINGDTAAGAIAGALEARRLLLLTDVAGVKNAGGEVVTDMTAADVERMIGSGEISGGMIPKVRTALDALAQGVGAAVILDGRAPHACLLELFTEHGAGTLIKA
ncbi:MAG: acetylglutamate kinase, partial [Pseudomonadota bacterium]